MTDVCTNKVGLVGEVVEVDVSEKGFHGFCKVKSNRLSNAADSILVKVKNSVLEQIYVGCRVSIVGKFRSINRRGKVVLYIYADWVQLDTDVEDYNGILLDGFLCKPPIYRETPSGRYISDVLLAVNSGSHSDYIPCIAWQDNALKMIELGVGTKLAIRGCIQSREYQKQIGDYTEVRTAYEVSIAEFDTFEQTMIQAE